MGYDRDHRSDASFMLRTLVLMDSIPLKPGLNEIETLVPAEWIGGCAGQAVLVVGYEVQGLPASDYSAPIACDLKDVRIFFWKGEVGYREDVRLTRFWVKREETGTTYPYIGVRLRGGTAQTRDDVRPIRSSLATAKFCSRCFVHGKITRNAKAQAVVLDGATA